MKIKIRNYWIYNYAAGGYIHFEVIDACWNLMGSAGRWKEPRFFREVRLPSMDE